MEQILQKLGYSNSSLFLREEYLSGVSGYTHVFKKAVEKCGLRGVYVLRQDAPKSEGIIPTVYVCEAGTDEQAREIHRLVWNQNIVPFLLVKSPRYLRLYKGFSYHHNHDPDIDTLKSLSYDSPEQMLNKINQVLSWSINADDIEQGQIWTEWGKVIQLDQRVDWMLLDQLKQLGKWLTDNGTNLLTAHALIGKFVYLRYLRDREILSDRKLEKWGIDPHHLFTRNATKKAFEEVNIRLDDWLNGSVFPLSHNDVEIEKVHIQKTAGVFFGDEVGGQLSFLPSYDFSLIPTETLSTIYEQFLHAEDTATGKSRGKKSGAHFTPISLVNLTLGEIERQKPLEEGMKILDPSCGSGAFLVQCYRRLIEINRSTGENLSPHKLKKLLVDHIYGVEFHNDACQVTALNLILTLLDNVNPPDLEIKKHERFELPDLLDRNIFHADFFEPNTEWTKRSKDIQFDWIVGNPPWKEVKTDSQDKGEDYAWIWMKENKRNHPVTDNQMAEPFIWKLCEYLSEEGVAGLVLPALTLTKEDLRFRKAFFNEHRVFSVVNLANLRNFLFYSKKETNGKKSSPTNPASIVCFRKGLPEPNDAILHYAPFAIEQIPSRSLKKQIPWSFAVNSSDLQEISVDNVSDGSHLRWKVAMWGTPRDMRLLKRIQKKFDSFETFCQEHELIAHEGFQLREKPSEEPFEEEVDSLPELEGKKKLLFNELRGCGRIFEFPDYAIDTISKSECYVRKGRGELPYKVSKPPHIIIPAARRFAVYSEEFIAVPSRQIGISGKPGKKNILKSLALYLNSDYAKYHEFFDSSEWGISINVATLGSLRRLPIPVDTSKPESIKRWTNLYDDLRNTSESRRENKLKELNDLVHKALGLNQSEKILVEDMVKYRIQLLDGKTPKQLLGKPSNAKIKSYLDVFLNVLDTFLGKPYHHEVIAYLAGEAALLQIRLFDGGGKIQPQIVKENSDLSNTLDQTFKRLRKQNSQWLYFDRCLKIYDGSLMYILKPLQLSQWLCSKALSDADDVIEEYLSTRG